MRVLEPLTSSSPSASPSPLLGIRNLRAKRAGSLMFVDLTADVLGTLSVRETQELEERITRTLVEARREIGEVRVRFCAVDV